MDLLGVVVRLVVVDSAVAERLGELLKQFPRSDTCPDAVVRLVRDRDSGRRHHALYHGDDLVQEAMPGPEAVATVLWYLNQLAATTTHHAVVHAGCVARDGAAIVLPAAMEAGKSTLVTALVLSGYDHLSDEFAPLSLVDGCLHPYPMPIVLETGSFHLFPQLAPKLIGELDHPARWHLAAQQFGGDSQNRPVPPGAIVFPHYRSGATCSLESVGATEAIRAVADQTINLHAMGAPAFDALARLVAGVPAYRLVFSDLDEACGALYHLDVKR